MFRYCLKAPLKLLSLNARQHSLINSRCADNALAALKRDKWTCCKCGTQLNEMMDVHHTGAHKSSKASDLAAICVFCHDREHPIWSASQRRWFPVYAPDWTQIPMTRLSWAVVANGGSGLDTSAILESIGDREDRAYEYLGTDNMESLIEGLFSVRDEIGDAAAQQLADRLDQTIRIVPTALRRDTPIQVWTPAGFSPVRQEMINASVPEHDPTSDSLRALAAGILGQVS